MLFTSPIHLEYISPFEGVLGKGLFSKPFFAAVLPQEVGTVVAFVIIAIDTNNFFYVSVNHFLMIALQAWSLKA